MWFRQLKAAVEALASKANELTRVTDARELETGAKVWAQLAHWYVEEQLAYSCGPSLFTISWQLDLGNHRTADVELLTGPESFAPACQRQLRLGLRRYGATRAVIRTPADVTLEFADRRALWVRHDLDSPSEPDDARFSVRLARSQYDWKFARAMLVRNTLLGHAACGEQLNEAALHVSALTLWPAETHSLYVAHANDNPNELLGFVCWTTDWDPWSGHLLWRIEDQDSIDGANGAASAAVHQLIRDASANSTVHGIFGSVLGDVGAITESLQKSGWRPWRQEWSGEC